MQSCISRQERAVTDSPGRRRDLALGHSGRFLVLVLNFCKDNACEILTGLTCKYCGKALYERTWLALVRENSERHACPSLLEFVPRYQIAVTVCDKHIFLARGLPLSCILYTNYGVKSSGTTLRPGSATLGANRATVLRRIDKNN